MSQDTLLPDPKITQQPPPEPSSSTRGIARGALCLLLILLFLFFFKNSDALQVFGILVAILSINLFEPVFGFIDRLDATILRILGRFMDISHLVVTSHLPVAGQRIKGHSHIIIPVICVLVIVYLLFHTFIATSLVTVSDFSCLQTSLPVPTQFCQNGIGMTALPDTVQIGLLTSSEQGPFDLSSLNGQEKQVESLIFQEDQQACSGAHITLADVSLLSRTIEDPTDSASKGLDDIRGAYLAQHDYNATRASYNPTQHGGQPFVSVCLLLANMGTLVTADQKSAGNLYTIPQIVKRLIQYNRTDPTFRGIVGFPYSTQASEAIHEFQQWGQRSIPIISPSATSYMLSNVANFYRVSPPDTSQGQAMAYYACHQLFKGSHPSDIDIFSNSDTYSSSLSSNFKDAVTSCFTADHIHYENYLNGNLASIKLATKHAMDQHYSLIYFPGYESDLDTLQAQIQSSVQGRSSHSITILGGDGLEDVVNPGHDTFAPVYSTVYASPLANADSINHSFVREYQSQNFPMPYLADAVPGYTLLPQGVIRSYNAMKMFTSTLNDLALQSRASTQDNINSDLASISFDGIGGHFSFQGGAFNSSYISDPQGKSTLVYIMCTTYTHNIRLAAIYNGTNLTTVQGSCS
ncbi:hypothetical protein [Dictyobacter arantiisoli]|uniref:Leucine-binding protein domain-containing protein n=1 Tax=Dictyobacter arantiisoli TaxID=2014874 RepID=A0A5A5THM6_9CHLR|nr:hypothetical protein [Dictyobacter arantiisoli]GCF10646.1 hypothetical protein KDI_42100 [Dictyobacter arantiisoli]